MVEDLLRDAWSDARHPRIFALRRAAAVLAQVRAFAALFAALTLAWIAIDASSLPAVEWMRLALERAVAAAAFGLLAAHSRMAHPTPRQARLRLAALFLVPAAFFAAAHATLAQFETEDLAQGVTSAYEFLPFVAAVGVAAFPLTLKESLGLTALAFTMQAYAAPAEPAVAWRLTVVGAIAIFAATRQMQLLSALVSEATRDTLTGCLRREAGLDLLEAQLKLAARRAEPFAVLFADLDRFKAVNDRFGHEEGDRVLAHAASALRAALRGSDLLLRWGGEEFVALLPGTSLTDAVRLVERLRERGAGATPDGTPVTLSIGVAEYRADSTESPAALVELADQRMYLAKAAGRNRYVATRDGIAKVLLPGISK